MVIDPLEYGGGPLNVTGVFDALTESAFAITAEGNSNLAERIDVLASF